MNLLTLERRAPHAWGSMSLLCQPGSQGLGAPNLCRFSGVCAPGLHKEIRDWGRGVNAAPQDPHPLPPA